MISIPEFQKFEQPNILANMSGQGTYTVQVWVLPDAKEAELLYWTLTGLLHDDPAVGPILLNPCGKNGKPTVFLTWRSAEATIRMQVYKQLDDAEPIAQAAIRACACTN